MSRLNTALLVGAALVGGGAMAAAAQAGSGTTKPASTPSGQPRQVTLTGCVRQTSDDPRMFALVPAIDAAKPTGTSGATTIAPLYRLDDKGQKLKGHVGHRVEITGAVTPAKDEKGADIIMTRRENIGVDTMTVTTVDLKPAPRLDIASVRKVAGECPKAPEGANAAGTAGSTAPRAATVGAISENPDRYVGQTVTVTGEVEKEFGPRVFSLDEDRVFSAGVDVLVLSRKAGAASNNQRVKVTGMVRKFVRAELQKEIIDFDLNPEWLVDFETRPVIIATDVAIVK